MDSLSDSSQFFSHSILEIEAEYFGPRMFPFLKLNLMTLVLAELILNFCL